MRIPGLLTLVFGLFLSGMAAAQTYPDYTSTTVNDFADLLNDEQEAAISAQLQELRDDTGIEMTVATLSLRAFHDPNATLEQFATKLFDKWGIGDEDRNDGILVLILRNDREIRIELGAGYGRDWDRAAANVIDRSFLPAFREDKYAEGIQTGVTDAIATIARPFHTGDAAPSSGSGFGKALALFGGFGALFSSIFWFPRLKARFSTCPSCGKRGLKLQNTVLKAATKASTGQGRRTTTCNSCGHVETSTYTISRKSSSSKSGSFGGGRSGGGGASGKW